jgi:hypothetical protein
MPSKYEEAANRLDAGFAKADDAEDAFIDTHRNAPKPSPDCLYGLIGDIAKAGSENTEANAFAVAASALAYLGVAVGRGPYMPIGDDWNHARLNFVHVGRSSRGRKGTAKKLVISRIAKAVKELNEHLAPQIHTGGLSTREGLALMIHDGWTQGNEEVPAIEDKRLLAVESEFANVLHQTRRDGNTLSAALRDAWDGTCIKPAIKTNRVWASHPHIGVLADITPSELRDLMASRELSNGFANRFIFFWAEGDKVNPFPRPTAKDVIDGFARRIADVLLFAGAERHVDRDAHRMGFSSEAALLYAKLYKGELRDRSAGEHITGLLDRRAPVLLRLAMIFAMTDKTFTIEVPHINAGMAWIRYWTDSVKFIFQSALDEVRTAQVNETAAELIDFLKLQGKVSRTELIKVCFKGHVSKDKLDAAIDELLTTSPPQIEVETVARAKGESGSSTKYYKLSANSANCAKSEHSSALQPDSPPLRTVRTDPPDFAELADVATLQNQPLSRMGIDISQISHNSQHSLENRIADLEDAEVF